MVFNEEYASQPIFQTASFKSNHSKKKLPFKLGGFSTFCYFRIAKTFEYKPLDTTKTKKMKQKTTPPKRTQTKPKPPKPQFFMQCIESPYAVKEWKCDSQAI